MLRLLTLSLTATATAAATALGATVVTTAGAPPLGAGPARYGAHEAVAPSPLAAVVPTARPVAPAAVKAAPKPRPRPRTTHRAAPVATSAPRVSHPALTAQQLMDRAIARLPGFHPGDARFVLKPGLGNWGLADLGGGIVYISPRVPANRMYDVVAHEWSHVLSVKPYDFDAMAAVDAMNSYFGGTGLVGAERAADCMARILGATWTHYTLCNNDHWRAGARTLLARKAL
jgi:hypothetical protein